MTLHYSQRHKKIHARCVINDYCLSLAKTATKLSPRRFRTFQLSFDDTRALFLKPPGPREILRACSRLDDLHSGAL
ncbi:hypothetical protein [Pantoea dispersa]|uniref:hypothetical protein n=1 Tax=Pantoea dispersa TaxID=59814 RepID=UPI000F66BF37|nr:hypothetical protein [Pantoea dispersa]MDI6635400.1 hypothetical protein [Pantoea dispersa]